MAHETNIKRIQDLEAALKRAKPKDTLRLDELALLWGVTKPRFVTVRNTMADYPAPQPGAGNEYVYPARKAINVMLAHERRHEKAAQARQDRANEIMGAGKRKGSPEAAFWSPTEMATLNRLAADIEERERAQGLFVPIAEVQAIALTIFSEFSDLCSRMPNVVDPHGALPVATRQLIDKNAKQALVHIHGTLKHILAADVEPRDPGTTASGARAAPARRQRKGRVPRKAG